MMNRKAAASLQPIGRHSNTKIRQDKDGFDDIDDYFAASPEPLSRRRRTGKTSLNLKRNTIAGDFVVTETARPVPLIEQKDDAYDEMVPLNDDYGQFDVYNDGEENDRPAENALDNDGDNDNCGDDDNVGELVFKESIKLVPSPKTSTAKSLCTRGGKRKSLKTPEKTPSTEDRKPLKPEKKKGPKKSMFGRFESMVELRNDTPDRNGDVRKSKRAKMPPLAYWKNEKVIYGRRQSTRMPVIVDILRRDQDEEKQKTSLIKRRSKSKVRQSSHHNSSSLKEAGFRPGINVSAAVMDYDEHCERERRIQ